MNTTKIFIMPVLMVSALILAGCEKNVQPTATTATATSSQTTTQPSSPATTSGSSKSSTSTTVTKPATPVVVTPGVVQPNQVTPAAKAAGVHRAIKKPIRRGGAIKYHNR